ncbi:hypothetical protein BN9982_330012 [Mycobacterium tuberculosis]|nr:hypothetical protein BN9982_330012 [Mycobacterium tuberculosis]
MPFRSWICRDGNELAGPLTRALLTESVHVELATRQMRMIATSATPSTASKSPSWVTTGTPCDVATAAALTGRDRDRRWCRQ